MLHFVTTDLSHFLGTWGYWAVLVFVMIESTGIPFPGETMLLVAAAYTGSTHHLSIVLVIAAAATGAIVGDNLGFLVGHEFGFRVLRRYGKYIRLDERKLKLGQYLFQKHGGKVVFFGRFLAVLRAWAAFLAGTNRMPWPHFLLANAAGGILWSTVFGLLGYIVGKNYDKVTGPIGRIFLIVGALILVAIFVYLRKNEKRLEEEAVRALPDPL